MCKSISIGLTRSKYGFFSAWWRVREPITSQREWLMVPSYSIYIYVLFAYVHIHTCIYLSIGLTRYIYGFVSAWWRVRQPITSQREWLTVPSLYISISILCVYVNIHTYVYIYIALARASIRLVARARADNKPARVADGTFSIYLYLYV